MHIPGILLDCLIYSNSIILVSILAWYIRLYVSHAQLPPKLARLVPFTNRKLLHSPKTLLLLCNHTTPSLSRLQKGIESYLKKSSQKYQIDVASGRGLTQLTRNHIQNAIEAKVDGIFTTNLFTTQLAQDILRETNSSIPLIFGNLTMKEHHIIKLLLPPHPTISGVVTSRDGKTELHTLKKILPHLKNILLLTPSHETSPHKEEVLLLQNICQEELAITCTQLALPEDRNLLAPYLTETDLVILLPDGLHHALVEEINALCHKHNTTLYVADSDMVPHGVPLGGGGGQEIIGHKMAHLMMQSIEQGILAAQLPVVFELLTTKVIINSAALSPSLTCLTPATLRILKRGVMYKTSY